MVMINTDDDDVVVVVVVVDVKITCWKKRNVDGKNEFRQ